MKKLIKPSLIKGTIKVPSSKSMMQRAVAIAILAQNKTVIHNPSYCEDACNALNIAKKLGAIVTCSEDKTIIQPGDKILDTKLDCGESGLCLRMFTPIASLYDGSITLEGKNSLRNRPVLMIEAPLKELGVNCRTAKGYLPITVSGSLKGGQAHIDCSITSQALTGLLIALPKIEYSTTLIVNDLKSKPYIDMTLDILKDFDVSIEHDDYKVFKIKGKQTYECPDYWIERDWSSAAFLVVAGALAGEIEIKGLKTSSKQADKKIIQVIKQSGARVIENSNSIKVIKNKLTPFSFDACDCPDIVPPLAAFASHCNGISTIHGTERLKFKESSRGKVIQKEFAKLGVRIDIENNKMLIYGGNVNGGIIDSNHDHRIAMAVAVAALRANNDVIIDGIECIKKSYPEFFDDLESIQC